MEPSWVYRGWDIVFRMRPEGLLYCCYLNDELMFADTSLRGAKKQIREYQQDNP